MTSGPQRTLPEQGAVAAVVLTFDARDALERCLGAIGAQEWPVAATIVVDNASPTRVDDLVEKTHGARLLRLPENSGPAGGYAAGLREFLASDAKWAWIMDDDCQPLPNTLGEQLRVVGSSCSVVLATMVDGATEAITNTHGWCAVLVHRAVIEAVGVPNADLFWWTEDTEYLQWRIPRAGFTVQRSPDARVIVNRARGSRAKPAWKYYYETRNQVYYRMHTQGHDRGQPVPRHLKLRVRSWRAARTITKLGYRALVVEREQRTRKLAMVSRGLVDGMRGRLGQTIRVDVTDRPRQDVKFEATP